MRKRRVAGWAATALLALVALAGVALWAGLSSERVARALIGKALTRTSDMVEIGEIRGSLNGPLVLLDVNIRTDVFAATVDSVLLDWTPIGIVRREVRLDVLHATGLHVVLPDSTPRDTAAPQRPELPVKVFLGDVVVQDISVEAPGDVGLSDGWARLEGTAEEYHLTARGRAFTPQLDSVPFTLDARGGLEQLALDSASVDLLEGRVAARGRLGWWPGVNWNLGLGAVEVRPSLLLADPAGWKGLVSATARTAGDLDSTGAHGRLLIDSVGGEMRGQPVSGTASIGFEGTTIDITSLDARWGSADLEASGTVAEGALDLRYDADIGDLGTAMPDAGGSLRATGTVTGTTDAALVRTRLAGRNVRVGTNRLARLEGDATIGLAPDGRTDVDLRGTGATAGAVAIRELALTMRGTRTAHAIDLAGSTADADVTLAARGGLHETTWRGAIHDVSVDADALGVWRLERPASLSAAPELVRVGQLCIASEPSRVCAEGSWRDNLNWSADALLERLPIALLDSLVPDTAQAGGRALTGTVNGTVDIEASGGRLGGLASLRMIDAAVLFPVPGDTAPDRLVFDTAAADLRLGADGLLADATVRFAAADGTPVGDITATVALADYTRADQTIATRSLDARVDAAFDDMSFAGRLDERIDSLTGRMTLSGTAAGTVGAPSVEADLGLEQVVAWLAGSRVASGSVDASLEGAVARDRSIAGSLRIVPRGVIYEYPLADVRRTLALDSGAVEVTAGADGVRALLALGVSDSVATRLASFDGELTLPEYRSLDAPIAPQPVNLRFTADVADLAVFQTVIEQFDTLTGTLHADLVVDGTVGAPQVEGTMQLRELLALFPQGGAIVGGLDGSIDAAVARDSTITGSFSITPAELALRVQEGDTARLIPIDSSGLAATVGPGGAQAELALHIADPAGGGVVGGELRLPRYTRFGSQLAAQPLTGRVAARIDDLAFVEGLTAMVDSAAGRLRLDAALSGTVSEPLASGDLELTDAAARLPLLGVLYRDIDLTARAENSESFAVTGSLASGPGTLRISGDYPLVRTVERPGTIRIQGEDFEAIHSADAHALVSPDLTVVLTGDSIDVSGEVELPLARLELAEFPEFAVAPSEDVVFVQDTAAERTGPKRFAARLRLVLGDSVTFRGFNFTAEFGGGLTYIQEPEAIATASGEVVIEQGRYRAYGQDLTITDGTLRFAGGPVDDPGLAIRAIRTADDGTVAGLQIGGTLQNPTVTIFSEPPMAQSRALAYIILGRAPGEGAGSGGALLSSAATSLGLRGGNALVGSLGEGLGLSQAGIETEGGNAAFVAGTYLAPNVYVSYGVGLFDPLTRLRLRYDISPRWAIQAERGAATGADVLFKTERGE